MERQQEEKSGTSIPKTSWNKKRKNARRSGLANIFWNRAVSAHAFCARGFHFRATLRACKMRRSYSYLFSCPYLVQFRIALYDSRLSSALQLFPSFTSRSEIMALAQLQCKVLWTSTAPIQERASDILGRFRI